MSSIVNWLVAFGAGFFGHVVAHDFCEVTPMISQKIVEAAASQLPSSIRDRYLEEWRADLRDQTGALAKLKWSIGCLICATRMRQAATLDLVRRTSLELTFDNGEIVVINMTSYAVFCTTLSYLYRFRRLITLAPKPVQSLVLRYAWAISRFTHRHWGPQDYAPVVKMLQVWAQGGSQPTKVAKLIDGKAVSRASFRDGELIADAS